MENIENIIFKEPKKTFMEILKIHNREVPFANILAFFFRPKENHNLKTLFIDALLETKCTNLGGNAVGEIDLEIPTYNVSSVEVKIEQKTKLGKRIDILIITNTFVICIEFKINHDFNNPLSNYKEYVDDNFEGKKKYYFILTPYKKDAIEEAKKYFENHNEFKQIILRHFINRVKEKIEENKIDLNENVTLNYFEDFIRTVENREIRSKRNLFLENLKKELNQKNILSEYHKNIGGGFLEIKKIENKLKIRFTINGIQIEEWNNKSFSKIICKPQKDLDIEKIIKQIILN